VTTVDDNLPRWDGQRRGFYEVWFLTWNDPITRDGYWLRYVIESPLPEVGEPYAQVWFARQSASDPARSFGINRRYPITSLVTGRDPFAVAIGPSRLGHDHAQAARCRATATPSSGTSAGGPASPRCSSCRR
jgi:hypothetical protein